MTDLLPILTDTPQFRRAVEAANAAKGPLRCRACGSAEARDVCGDADRVIFGCHMIDTPTMETRYAAFLAVLMDDTCPRCMKGVPESHRETHADYMKRHGITCPNPECKDGKVKPPLYTQEMVDVLIEKARDGGNLADWFARREQER